MFAALDESTPELPNGIAYVMTGVVLLADEGGARKAARAVLPTHRVDPFHWHREGPVARAAMIACLVEIGAVARVVIHSPNGPAQAGGRARQSLGLLVNDLVAEKLRAAAASARPGLGRRGRDAIGRTSTGAIALFTCPSEAPARRFGSGFPRVPSTARNTERRRHMVRWSNRREQTVPASALRQR